MLEFSVSNQLLSRLDATEVVSGSQNYLECRFQFSEDWEGLKKVAVFGHSGVADAIGVELEDDCCQVPWEVIAPYGFQVALYGSGGEEGAYTHVPTSVVTVEVSKSGAEEDLTAEPTKSLYDSVMVKLKEAQEAMGETKVTVAANAKQAHEAALGAEEAKARAEDAEEVTAEKALSAAGSAKAAEKSKEVCLSSQESCEDDRYEVKKLLKLAQTYLRGSGVSTYEQRIAKSNVLDFTEGPVTDVAVPLEPWARYKVKLGSRTYEGFAIPVLEEGCLVSEEAFGSTPLPVSDGEEEEVPVEPGEGDDQVELPEENPESNILGKRVVRMEAAGLVIEHTKIVPAVEVEGESYESTVISGGTGKLYTFMVYTDGGDNCTYCMNQTTSYNAGAGTIYKNCQTIQSTCSGYQTKSKNYAAKAETAAQTAESWAAGGTGSRDGEDSDNAKYYCQQAQEAAQEAQSAVSAHAEDGEAHITP